MAGNPEKKYNNAAMAVVTGIRDLFRPRQDCGILKESDRLDGKTVFIDGASSGLGFATAIDVARRGARVIMACRSGIPVKGEIVQRRSGNPDVSMLPVNLSDIASIRDLVSAIARLERKPDIYILNAGIVSKESRKTPQGLEEMFMVNYFAKYLFVRLLMEHRLIPDSGAGDTAARVIFVTSESHRNPEAFDWDGFGNYREHGIRQSMERYGYYKLLLVTFARELSRRLNPGRTVRVSVFALCPGPINSGIAREAPKMVQPLLKLIFFLFFRSPARAAEPVVYLTASADLDGKPFGYLYLMSRREIDPKAEDPENGKRLWELSERLLCGLLQK